MIVSTEGIHDFNGSELIFNDRLGGYPMIFVRQMPGLRRSPDFEPVADKLYGRMGTVPRRADRGGKSYAYEGELRARSLSDLRTLEGDLTAAMSIQDERLIVAKAHEDSDIEMPERIFWAMPTDRDDDDSQNEKSYSRTDYGYMREFSVAMRMSDPRFYFPLSEAVEEESSTIIMAGGNGTPYVPGDEVEPGSGEAIEVTVDSPGNADVDPLVTIEGPSRNPVVSNETLGVFLRFRDLVLDEDEEVHIDFRRRTAKRTNGTDVRHKLDPSETWWNPGVVGLQPQRFGSNVIRYRAYDMSAGAKLTVWHLPADYA